MYSSRCCKLGTVLVLPRDATVRERLAVGEEVGVRGRTTRPVKADEWWHTRERLRRAAQARVAAAAIVVAFGWNDKARRLLSVYGWCGRRLESRRVVQASWFQDEMGILLL